MAVVRLKEVTSRSAAYNQYTEHRYTRTFEAYTDDSFTSAATVQATVALPKLGDPFQEVDAFGNVLNTDPYSTCVDRIVENNDENNFQKWTIRCEYVGLSDPTAVPAEVEFDPVPYQKTLIETADSPAVPIANSAGDPFEHGITVDRSRWRLIIVQNVLDVAWNPVIYGQYNDTLNKVPFLAGKYPPGFTTNTCKLQIGAQRVQRSDTKTFYWRRRAVIDINVIDKYGWVSAVRDVGFREKRASDGKKIAITDANGLKPSSPVPLDGNGHKLADGATLPAPLFFNGYVPKDWSGLNLENW